MNYQDPACFCFAARVFVGLSLFSTIVPAAKAQSLDGSINTITRIARSNADRPGYERAIKACVFIRDLGSEAHEAQTALLTAANCHGPTLSPPSERIYMGPRTDDWRGHLAFKRAGVDALSKIEGDAEEIAAQLSNLLRGMTEEWNRRHLLPGKDEPKNGFSDVTEESNAYWRALYHEVLRCLASYGPAGGSESLDVLSEIAQLPIVRSWDEIPGDAISQNKIDGLLYFAPRASIMAIETMGYVTTREDEDAYFLLEELAEYSDDRRIKNAAKKALAVIEQR